MTNCVPTLMIQPDGCMMMPGPLYQNGLIVWSCSALLAGNHVVVLPRFDAVATLAGIEEHRADIAYLVPTMMNASGDSPSTCVSATTSPRSAWFGTWPSPVRLGSRRPGLSGSGPSASSSSTPEPRRRPPP